MAIDKAALRKGTLWVYPCRTSNLRREVKVLEVSENFVIFCKSDDLAEMAEAVAPWKFLADAHDLATYDFESLVEDIERHSNTPGRNVNTDNDLRIMVCLLRDAVVHLMGRLGPPAPLNLVPAPAAMPVVVSAEPVAVAAEEPASFEEDAPDHDRKLGDVTWIPGPVSTKRKPSKGGF
ncbi:hypothetical protein [Methylobacterium organophilum]|uniref:Uncharacterized protein n=1 Tax=Methylobacterium organophilum TaxID=410 RepID=A0ABQ4THI1_METOR|nr:hypothetical protein [Methylobacterium organophilum]GJE29799.1 hypothetical protein LKMONMHP_4685 [Methylobacterium organophilum]